MEYLKPTTRVIPPNKHTPTCGKRISVTPVALPFSSNLLAKELARKLRKMGDENFRNNNDSKAIFYYKEAIKTKPDYASPYYNLAKTYKKLNKTEKIIPIYKELLKIKPDEIEAETLLGKCYKENGDYLSAQKAFKNAVKINHKYDFANRSLNAINNLLLSKKDPAQAKNIKDQVAQNKLRTSLDLVSQHAPADLTKGLRDINIVFGETDSLSGYKNIAQYENHNKRIVITNDFIWAAPEIIASYIIHEAVHAKDKDGLSSIMEEQNAYNDSIAFWITHNNGVKDPELDYAAKLYKENPEVLREKVGETYRSRDESIPEYSPNHMPKSGLGLISKMKVYFQSSKNFVLNKKNSYSTPKKQSGNQ